MQSNTGRRRSRPPDIGARLTVALVSIPEGMAPAPVAGVRPIHAQPRPMLTDLAEATGGANIFPASEVFFAATRAGAA